MKHTPYYVVAAVFILAMVALPIYDFHDRDYHQDEINTVHAAQVLDVRGVVIWMATNGVHPPGWRIAAAEWVKLTGTQEPAVRHFSTLCTMIALALTFRLASDLFDRRTGLYAVLLLGTLPYALFFMHEFRPYPALVLVTAGSLLAFLRWLRRPDFKHALLYVLFGVVALQTHYYGALVIAACAVVFVTLVRWNRALYLRAVGLWIAIGLSMLSFILPLLDRLLRSGGKVYALSTDWRTVKTLYTSMRILPAGLGDLILAVGILLAVGAALTRYHVIQSSTDRLFRCGSAWRRLYLVVFAAALIAVVAISNMLAQNLTLRNLVVLAPILAMLAADGLRRLPWQAGLIALLIIGQHALTDFQAYRPVLPYRATAAFLKAHYQPGDRVVQFGFTHEANLHYLLDRMPATFTKQAVYLVGPARTSVAAEPTPYRATIATPEKLEEFRDFLGDTPRVWLLLDEHGIPGVSVSPFWNILTERYAAVQQVPLGREAEGYFVIEYRRLPDNLQGSYPVGTDDIHLRGWTIPTGTDVKACEAVEVETWWQATAAPAGDYEIAVELTGEDGQIAAQVEAPPSFAPTSQWAAETYYLDLRTLAIPCDLMPGTYSVKVWLDDPAAPNDSPSEAPATLTTLRVSE
jgi:hypothetical protein